MKKTILIILGVGVLAMLLVVLAGMYKFNYLASQPGYDVDGNQTNVVTPSSSWLDATYSIDGQSVRLVNGSAESEAAPESATKIVTEYFGNELKTDLNNDGQDDVVFLLTQTTGGSGTFFYVVAAVNTTDGWVGSDGFLLGDRIAPQTTEVSQNSNHQNVMVVNYMDRMAGEAMTDKPSVGKSVWLKLDTDNMMWGEVEQNFPGEADPDMMTLEMKAWTWVKTTYNNDTEITPTQTDAFTLTFKDDGLFSATTDCNSIGGSYEVDGKQINFGQMATTLMFCEDSQEADFSKLLEQAQSYFFTSQGQLVFELKLDSGSAIFR